MLSSGFWTFKPIFLGGEIAIEKELFLFDVSACIIYMNFPGSEVQVSACNAGDLGSIPGWGRSSGEGNGNPLQYSCLENPMDGGAWWATVHRVQSQKRLSDFTFTFLVNRVTKKCRPNLSTSQPSGEVTFSSKQWNHWFQHRLGFGQLPCYVQTRVIPWPKSGLFFQLELCKSFFKKKKQKQKTTAQKSQEWSWFIPHE